MFEGLKHWFGRRAAAATGPGSAAGGTAVLQGWAERHRHGWRGVRDSEGGVVDGRLGALPWRLEWGPPQRVYVQTQELRLRAELGVPAEVQAVVMNRLLAQALEAAVFEQYVEGVQTRIDTDTPPEARWLVMHAKLGAAALGPLRERATAAGSPTAFVAAWLQGALAEAWLAQPAARDDAPLVLTVSRGRLTLRAAMPQPDEATLDARLRLFETAMREARRAAEALFANPGPSTQPSLWNASVLPPGRDEPPRR